MEIINMSDNMDLKEQYRLTHSNEAVKMTDAAHDGVIINLAAWIIYTDNQNERDVDIIALKDVDGTIYATNSTTFIREFEEMVRFFKGDIKAIKPICGIAKSGREFVTCDLAE